MTLLVNYAPTMVEIRETVRAALGATEDHVSEDSINSMTQVVAQLLIGREITDSLRRIEIELFQLRINANRMS